MQILIKIEAIYRGSLLVTDKNSEKKITIKNKNPDRYYDQGFHRIIKRSEN